VNGKKTLLGEEKEHFESNKKCRFFLHRNTHALSLSVRNINAFQIFCWKGLSVIFVEALQG
jgi:hypothetical protein